MRLTKAFLKSLTLKVKVFCRLFLNRISVKDTKRINVNLRVGVCAVKRLGSLFSHLFFECQLISELVCVL